MEPLRIRQVRLALVPTSQVSVKLVVLQRSTVIEEGWKEDTQ